MRHIKQSVSAQSEHSIAVLEVEDLDDMSEIKPTTTEESINQDVWTAEDVARYLRCTSRHVTNLARRGEIPGRRFGNIWRFRRQDIQAFR